MTQGGEKTVDRYKLEYEIKSRGHSVESFCKGIGISRSAYYRKVDPSCSAEFTLGEIERAVDFLELDSPMGIFFKVKVS